jgi:hypothetical protein
MQCQMKRLTPLLCLLSLPILPQQCQHMQAVDSYCSVYSKVVRGKGDGTIAANSEVKKRILANEITFRDLCEAKK